MTGVGVLAVVGGMALSDRTNLDAGVTMLERGRPEIGEHILDWTVHVEGIRLYVGGAETPLCERDLSAGVPLVAAGEDWCICLLFGPTAPSWVQPSIRLRMKEGGFVMGFRPQGNGVGEMRAGMLPSPYAWYYLSALSTPDESAVAAFVDRSNGIQVDESAPDADPIHVSILDGQRPYRLRFSSRVQEAREWTSNGWSVFVDASSR